MMKLLIVPVLLVIAFGTTVAAAPDAAGDFAMIYGVLFLLSLAPASIHIERHR